MLSMLEQGSDILSRTADPLLSKANQTITALLPEQTHLTQQKKSDTPVGTFNKAVQLGQNLVSLGLQTLSGVGSTIQQTEPLEDLMLRKKLEERGRYEKMRNQVVQKFIAMKNALDRHKQDHGQFYIDGSVNHAFISFPFDNYLFDRNAIVTDSDYISVFPNKNTAKMELFECKKDKLLKSAYPSSFSFNRSCRPAEYGKNTLGRISTLEKLNTELDLVKTAIYSTDIPGISGLQQLKPESGSYADNIKNKVQEIINPFY